MAERDEFEASVQLLVVPVRARVSARCGDFISEASAPEKRAGAGPQDQVVRFLKRIERRMPGDPEGPQGVWSIRIEP
jgi:hypothetical protein